MNKVLFFILCTLCLFNARSQENDVIGSTFCKIVNSETEKAKGFFHNNKANRPEVVDISYYRLDVFTVPDSLYIAGSVTAYFKVTADSTDHLIFDLSGNMIVDSAYFGGSKSTFLQNIPSDEVEIRFSKMLYTNDIDSVTVFYKGRPTQTGFGAFKITSHNSNNVLWTLSEPYGAKEWWPNKQTLSDKADSIDIIVTTSFGNRVASNGLLIGIDTVGSNLHRFHWKSNYPIAAYLMAIAITNYEVHEEMAYFATDSMKLYYYLYPNDSTALANSMYATVPFMHLFDSLFGTYPFIKEKYGHASFGFGGGMEHQTMSFMGGYSGELIAHELAHQWFGDAVTCASWQDVWLNEGFANYMVGLTYENHVVHDSAFWYAWKRATVNASTSVPHGSVWVDDTTVVNRIFSSQLTYSKGSYLLHMLRWKMGDSAFFAGARNYLNDPALSYGFATTDDLKRHLETSSGMNLTEFFADWFYGKGFPTYHTSWTYTAGNLELSIDQTPSDTSVSFFDIPLQFLVKGSNKDTLLRVEPTYSPQTISVPVSFQPQSVEFDPDLKILSRNNLITQLESINYDDALELFPNPTTGDITIKYHQSLTPENIWIYDMSGRMVKEMPFKEQFSLIDLKPGAYYMQLGTQERMYRKKIIKL